MIGLVTMPLVKICKLKTKFVLPQDHQRTNPLQLVRTSDCLLTVQHTSQNSMLPLMLTVYGGVKCAYVHHKPHKLY